MKARIKRINPLPEYTRVDFTMESGAWAFVDLYPDESRHAHWRNILDAGPGTILAGLTMINSSMVDPGSRPAIVGPDQAATMGHIFQRVVD